MRSRNKEIQNSHAAIETALLEFAEVSEEEEEEENQVILEESTINPLDLIMSDDEYSMESEH